MKTLTELGIRVPEQVSIVGFDNISESRIISPELTTVHVEKKRMAQLAVDLLIESIEQGVEATSKSGWIPVLLSGTRLIRRSSAN